MKTLTQHDELLVKPYIDSKIQTLTNNDDAMLNELGAKNLLPNAVQTSVNYGLQFTRNTDDSITVTGNKSDGSSHSVDLCTSLVLKAGEYYLSDGLSGVDNINILIYDKSSGTAIASTRARTSPAGFDLASDTEVGVNIEVRGATTVAFNYRLYPMIRPASIKDNTYTPYAMTNQELTTDKAEKSDLTAIDITGTTNNTGSTISEGTFFYLNGILVRAKVDIANNATFTLNTNYEQVTAGALNRNTIRSKTFEVTLTANNGELVTIDISNYNLNRNPKIISIVPYFSEILSASVFVWYVRSLNSTQIVIGIKMDISITNKNFVLQFM